MRLILFLVSAVFLFHSLGLADTPVRIVILGDSLTDGYGVAKDAAYPAVLGRKFKEAGHSGVDVVNAGISGSTTASAESRFRWHLKKKPDVLMIALGGNDGLRGMKLAQTKKNLSNIISSAKKEKIEVVLAGMKIPPNYGKEYTEGFEQLYRELAKEFDVALIPFLLEGVGGEKELNQTDGIHPNEKGHVKMAETVYPHLLKLVEKRKSQKNASPSSARPS
ncbi:MAG TPA: arylesterase [Bdellovibrionales bacterium]|nr:arylesterase [Bdellovibrionales bacterium]